MSEVSPEKRFDLQLEGAELADALRLVASVAEKSLVVGPGVEGTVTLTMKNVTVEDVLERLKKDFNLSVEEKGNTLVVTKAE